MIMKEFLKEERFAFISDKNKDFIVEFTKALNEFRYDFSGEIGDGYCWGRYMIIYSKVGVKTKQVIARFYLRDDKEYTFGKGQTYKFDKKSIVLRLFLNKIDKHISYIEKAPEHIKDKFISDKGLCKQCTQSYQKCHHYKKYTIDSIEREKCGYVFCFEDPKIEHLKDYVDLLKEFYGSKRS